MPLPHKSVTCLLVLLLFTLGAINAVGSERTYFPSDVTICSTKDPNFNKCFTDSANKMLKHLSKGSRELNAVPMQPLRVPLMRLRRNNKLLPTLAFNFTNTIHEGWKDAVVLRSNIKPKDREFNMIINIPRYRWHGLYDVTGSITGIPMEGSGNMDCTFINMTNDIHMRGHLKERNAQEFFVIDDFRQKTTVDNLMLKFDNLFNDTKLSDTTNKLLSVNSPNLLDEGSGVRDKLWGEMHAGLMQRIFDRVPFKVMFPDLD
ncbi:Protein takeout [Gryllus bimaculatus]|nr:Protein takeout [Gryllus bimaculatus]